MAQIFVHVFANARLTPGRGGAGPTTTPLGAHAPCVTRAGACHARCVSRAARERRSLRLTHILYSCGMTSRATHSVFMRQERRCLPSPRLCRHLSNLLSSGRTGKNNCPPRPQLSAHFGDSWKNCQVTSSKSFTATTGLTMYFVCMEDCVEDSSAFFQDPDIGSIQPQQHSARARNEQLVSYSTYLSFSPQGEGLLSYIAVSPPTSSLCCLVSGSQSRSPGACPSISSLLLPPPTPAPLKLSPLRLLRVPERPSTSSSGKDLTFPPTVPPPSPATSVLFPASGLFLAPEPPAFSAGISDRVKWSRASP